MAKGFTIELVGLKDWINRLEKTEKAIIKEIDTEIAATAVNIDKEAKRDAPVNYGKLRNSIYHKKVGKLTYEVGTQVEYGAYLEFGTKTYAQIPAELQSYAAQFRGKGRGSYEELVDALTKWIKRKGIAATQIKYVKSGKNKGKVRRAGSLKQGIEERNLAKFIAFIILTKGIKAQPFLFPAVFRNRPKMYQNVLDVVNKKREI